jgi:hypothetical protein
MIFPFRRMLIIALKCDVSTQFFQKYGYKYFADFIYRLLRFMPHLRRESLFPAKKKKAIQESIFRGAFSFFLHFFLPTFNSFHVFKVRLLWISL